MFFENSPLRTPGAQYCKYNLGWVRNFLNYDNSKSVQTASRPLLPSSLPSACGDLAYIQFQGKKKEVRKTVISVLTKPGIDSLGGIDSSSDLLDCHNSKKE